MKLKCNVSDGQFSTERVVQVTAFDGTQRSMLVDDSFVICEAKPPIGQPVAGWIQVEVIKTQDDLVLVRLPVEAFENGRILTVKKTDLHETASRVSLDAQVGGTHYSDMPIQPVEFIYRNGIGFIEGCVIKYLCRWRKKNGIEDLEKARHFLNILIALERKQGQQK